MSVWHISILIIQMRGARLTTCGFSDTKKYWKGCRVVTYSGFEFSTRLAHALWYPVWCTINSCIWNMSVRLKLPVLFFCAMVHRIQDSELLSAHTPMIRLRGPQSILAHTRDGEYVCVYMFYWWPFLVCIYIWRPTFVRPTFGTIFASWRGSVWEINCQDSAYVTYLWPKAPINWKLHWRAP